MYVCMYVNLVLQENKFILPARFEQVTIWPRLLERWLTVNQWLNPPNQWLKANRGLVSVARTPAGLVHDNAHARRFSLQNKFVGSTLNSKSPLPVQSLKILRFIRTSVALAGLVILR